MDDFTGKFCGKGKIFLCVLFYISKINLKKKFSGKNPLMKAAYKALHKPELEAIETLNAEAAKSYLNADNSASGDDTATEEPPVEEKLCRKDGYCNHFYYKHTQ